jgi:hypothetical protein
MAITLNGTTGITTPALDNQGNLTVDGGTIKLDGNYPVGTGNVALGDTALDSVVTDGDYNTAVGAAALTADTKGQRTVAIGASALESQNFTSATVSYNTAVGFAAGSGVTTGINNTLIGGLAGDAITTGGSNVALGTSALSANTTASNNTAVGYQAGYSNTTGDRHTAIGFQSVLANTTGARNTGVGAYSLGVNQTGNDNVAIGDSAIYASNANSNTAVGSQAGYTNSTGTRVAYFGKDAGKLSTVSDNTFIGQSSGSAMTTGSSNTILGRYTGNAGGLDIRTSSNNIVLSDGDGNPRMWVYNGYSNFSNTTSWQSGGINAHSFEQNDVAQDILHLRHPAVSGGYGLLIKLDGSPNNTTNYFIQAADASAAKFRVYSNGNVVNTNNSYGSISDVKLKENIVDSGSQWDDIKALTVRKYSMKADNLDAPNMLGVIAQEVEIAGMGGLVITSPDLDPETKEDLGTVTKQVNYSILYMKAVKALQEAMDRIETLEAQNASFEARITALEGN